MKKTLIALAAVAVSSAAMAQVTIAGKMNIGVQKTGDASANLAGGADGSDSRIMFRGSEEIGSLKANFHAETGFKTDTGNLDNAGAVTLTTTPATATADAKTTATSSASKLFQRQVWAGLSGGFGEIRAGRQYTLGFFGSIGNMPSTYTDPMLNTGLGFNGMGARNDDQIQYWSPRMGGVQLRASTQLKGDVANATTEVALNYANGPVSINLTTGEAKNVDSNKMALDVSYNLGVATLAAGFVDTDSAAGDGYVVRAVVPMGAASIHAGYATNSETKVNAYNVGAFYNLSKRTRLYALHGSGNKTVTDKTAIGIDHNF
jgi:predicted porin